MTPCPVVKPCQDALLSPHPTHAPFQRFLTLAWCVQGRVLLAAALSGHQPARALLCRLYNDSRQGAPPGVDPDLLGAAYQAAVAQLESCSTGVRPHCKTAAIAGVGVKGRCGRGGLMGECGGGGGQRLAMGQTFGGPMWGAGRADRGLPTEVCRVEGI